MTEPETRDDSLFLLYHDIGLFLTKKQITDLANIWYTRSLEINPSSAACYYSRSVNSANSGHGAESLKDAKIALKINSKSTVINLQEASAYLHCNDFEEAIMSLHNNSKKFNSNKMTAFSQEIECMKGIYDSSLGPEFGQFAYANKNLLKKISEEIQAKKHIEDKPLWKRLQEAKECDVMSQIEIKEDFIHPLEIERRKLAYKKFNQIYAGRSWNDIVFLNKLRHSKTLLLPQTQFSTQQMRKSVNENFDIATSFFKMLHAQDPLYHTRIKSCPSIQLSEKRLQAHLYKIQYRTSREMFMILDNVKALRKAGKTSELIEYVENTMSVYPPIKIRRVMPWKFEFIYDIYNSVGLAYMDEILTPLKLSKELSTYTRILEMLRVKKDEKKNINYVFGNKSTFQEPDAKDYGFIRYQKQLIMLENWVRIAKYPLEKMFIMHQISMAHLKNEKYKECLTMIGKCKLLCQTHENNLWSFLSTLVSMRAYALQERMTSHIAEIENALKYAKILKIAKLSSFLKTLYQLNVAYLKKSDSIKKFSN